MITFGFGFLAGIVATVVGVWIMAGILVQFDDEEQDFLRKEKERELSRARMAQRVSS